MCLLPYCRISGLESNRKILSKSSQNSINRLSNSISRSRSRVWELAMCNPWQYWCTFTTDEKKIDRFNLDTYQKNFLNLSIIQIGEGLIMIKCVIF